LGHGRFPRIDQQCPERQGDWELGYKTRQDAKHGTVYECGRGQEEDRVEMYKNQSAVRSFKNESVPAIGVYILLPVSISQDQKTCFLYSLLCTICKYRRPTKRFLRLFSSSTLSHKTPRLYLLLIEHYRGYRNGCSLIVIENMNAITAQLRDTTATLLELLSHVGVEI
jgi:hypothetical protein